MIAADIEFDAASHRYTVAGQRYESVTEVLEPLINFDDVPRDKLKRAGARGDYVHSAMALAVRDLLDWDSLDDTWRPYIRGGMRFIHETGATIIASECRVACSPLRIAGTLDLVVYLRGWETIVEFKASAEIPPTAGPQTAAYERFYTQMYGGLSRPRMCVLLKPDDYRIESLTNRNDYNDFLSSLNCYRWRKQHYG